ncbi:MAG: hypothetical protein SFV15_26490 [Polyangiaceae bacterium]|nr:hypothetical protein [Polyangiaceae bacterium]
MAATWGTFVVHVTRDPQLRREAGFTRLMALALACALCFQFALGGGVSCVVAAMGEDTCETPCGANFNRAAAFESARAETPVEVGEFGEQSSTECPCPFDCSLGCGAQSRAVAVNSVAFGVVLPPYTILPELIVRPMPGAAEPHGIMHVPKRAVLSS